MRVRAAAAFRKRATTIKMCKNMEQTKIEVQQKVNITKHHLNRRNQREEQKDQKLHFRAEFMKYREREP